MRKKGLLASIAILIIILAISLFSALKKRENISKEPVVRIADSSTAPNSWELATKLTGRDILKEEGVNIQKISGTSTAPSFQALLSSQYDVAGWGWVGWVNVQGGGGESKSS